jgi:hypothetical protein
MINIKKVNQIADTDEGKVLLATIAILTSIDEQDIEDDLWEGMVHPDEALERIVELANKIYYEEEWTSEQISKERDSKLNKIIE